MHILKQVRVQKRKNLAKLLSFASPKDRKSIIRLARDLQKKRVLQINATPRGGGVAEILKSFVGVLKALGIDASWYAIDGSAVPSKFFAITNKIHNSLQGLPENIHPREWKLYEKINKQIAQELERIPWDVLIVHDPQLIPVIQHLPTTKPVALIIHIDTSDAQRKTWKTLLPYINQYENVVLSNAEFIHKDIVGPQVSVFSPPIDPIAPKQTIVPQQEARTYLARHGIPKEVPLIVQVSRFDIWKNPFGVVEAFRMVTKKYPSAHLALVGFREAKDNPEAEKVFTQLKKFVGNDPNIHLFFDPKNINICTFTYMAQNGADIVVQNSTKEGFGMVVAEAMWKHKAVVGGNASGIRKQIKNGYNGFIIKTSKQLAQKIIYLMTHPKEKAIIEKRAHESVEKRFLLPSYVLHHLKIYQKMIES